MATLSIKNFDDRLYEKLKQQANAHHRSIAGEVTTIIERALGERSIQEEELFQRARQVRQRSTVYVTDEDLRAARERGRA